MKNTVTRINIMSENKIAIVIHGGAGPKSDFIKEHEAAYKKGLEEALNAGYGILESGGTAVEAVETAVKHLEDNWLFNAGRGSALTENARVQMCASIMDGKRLNSGAVAIVSNVKNPVSLARAVMERSTHIYLGAEYAVGFARDMNLEMEADAYFITNNQFDDYARTKSRKARETGRMQLAREEKEHGTVGAVALDKFGNVAAATSTGGTPGSKEGRIADSSMVGVGTYANVKTCAVSCTGDGEYTIRGVIAHDISACMEYKKVSLKEACRIVMEKQREIKGDMGFIAVDTRGNFEICFNAERMHRGWRRSGQKGKVALYKEKHNGQAQH
jgi:L-asparaginase / beta-aspartyl-peptidase